MKRFISTLCLPIVAATVPVRANADNAVVRFEDCSSTSWHYPYNSSNPRTGVGFNESEILTGYGSNGPIFYVDYNDEHAMVLGVSTVTNTTGATIETGTVSPLIE